MDSGDTVTVTREPESSNKDAMDSFMNSHSYNKWTPCSEEISSQLPCIVQLGISSKSGVSGAPNADDSDTESADGSNAFAGTKKCINLNDNLDVLLLQSVMYTDAHLITRGEIEINFTEALSRFKESFPPSSLNSLNKLQWKTVYNKFKKLSGQDAIKGNTIA